MSTAETKKLDSQAIRFEELKELIGYDLALFCMCAVCDKQYIETEEMVNWYIYSVNIAKDTHFDDGDMDVNTPLLNSLSEKERWVTIWGIGDEKKPYTEDDYKRLDELFRTYSSRLQRAGGMDAQQEDTLRSCSRMRLEADKAIAKGGKDNISIASTLNKMIQENLSAEQLRKKDEKPVEELRIDTIVDALEKAGMLRKGKILALEDLQEALLRRLGALGGKPSHKYPYTFDAADQMIQIIANNMYSNDELPEITELPDNMQLDPSCVAEFEEKPSDEEKEVYKKMGLVRKVTPHA